jgi:hypothetical protein
MKKSFLATMVLLATASLAGGLVKWTDEKGTVHYSEQPPAGVTSRQVPIAVGGNSPSALAPASASMPAGAIDSGLGAMAGAKGGIDDADAVPYLSAGGRARYREFLSRPSPRAFVICPTGAFQIMLVVGNYPEKLDKMISERQAGCEPYAINDQVVWSRQ